MITRIGKSSIHSEFSGVANRYAGKTTLQSAKTRFASMHPLKEILFCGCFFWLCCEQVFSQETAPSPNKGFLYNGVCWARNNVDKPGTFAPTPYSYGMLYQWNSKKVWIATESASDKDNSTTAASHWKTANDPCPAGWRIPTIEEARTLTQCKGGSCSSHQNFNYYWWIDGDYWKNPRTDTLTLPLFGAHTTKLHTTVAVSPYGYWSSSGNTDDDSKAWMFSPNSDSWGPCTLPAPRDYAFYIRCVAEKHDTVIDVFETIFAEDLPYEWGDTIFQEGTKTGTYRFQQNGCAFTNTIDLHLTVNNPCPGVLINDVCWAECDVDAPGTFTASPEIPGLLYFWNDRKGWPCELRDDWGAIVPCIGDWDADNDPCPSGWRMPTVEEIRKLNDTSRISFNKKKRYNGIPVIEFTDRYSTNILRFPLAGYINRHFGFIGEQYAFSSDYWSTSFARKAYQEEYNEVWVLSLAGIRIGELVTPEVGTWMGNPIRCVTDWKCATIFMDTYDTICANALPYEWRDTVFDVGTKSGIYRFQRISTVTGCD
ncbi:MAG: fibrobacter succinogenes major paralogous domain-containing protein, partial [Odoribacter sp.]|nr:fibrobacter succinogenes major paralogous domain-containing protein [Odoribacter sp.]